MQKIIVTLLLALSFGSVMAQKGNSREELERRRIRLLESIRQTQSELAATRQDKKITLGQLQALQVQLANRQKLIHSISTELGQINGSIQSTQKEVTKLSSEVTFLQMRYAQSIRYAYRNRNSQSMMAYLFSASSFNDGIRRLAYLRKFRDYRMAQADQIRIAQGRMQKKIGILNNEKARKNVLRRTEETQKQVLQSEAAQTDRAVRELRGRESELSATVTKNQRDARNLERAISDAIRREIEIARKKAEEEARRQAEIQRRQEEERQRLAAARAAAEREAAAKAAAQARANAAAKAAEEDRKKAAAAAAAKTPPSNTKTYGNGTVALNTGSDNTNTPPPEATPPPAEVPSSRPAAATPPPVRPPVRSTAPVNLGLTPEAAALSASFESNRGRLPWPVEKGFIVSGYGRQKHPVAEKVIIENNGIDIQTPAGATARAVFEGTVSKVFYIAGFGQNVLISHGGYYTVYNGLANVSVAAGQKVNTKQAIGTVGPNEEGIHILKFQVWKGASTQNPAGWIAQ